MHLNQEVLKSAKFPGILYESSLITVSKQGDALYAASMDGELSLHGVRRKLPITARVAMQGSTLRASGEFSIRQSDFGIKLVSVAGGAIKLKTSLHSLLRSWREGRSDKTPHPPTHPYPS